MSSDVLTLLGVLLSVAMAGSVGYAAFTLINAWSRRLNAKQAPPGLDPDEVEALRAQSTDLEELRTRLLEVEERLDFAERMLTESRAGTRLPPVHHDTPV